MEKAAQFQRPPFEQALIAWEGLLGEAGFSKETIWLFDENLCFESEPGSPGGVRLGYQTALTPPPPDAHRIAYEQFCESNAPIVWYRLGFSRNKSVCMLLCDPWFETKFESAEYSARPEWRMLFRRGPAQEIEEITDKSRWEKRLLRQRPIPELDFSMSLRAVHEVLAHGRVLTAYEHYALKLLHVWRHWLGEQH